MTASKANWQRLVDEVNRRDLKRGELPSRPATEAEIASLRQRASEYPLRLDEDFLTFLRYANGIVYNGLTIPRAEVMPQRGSDDFVEYNDDRSFVELGPVYGNYGNRDDTYYVLYTDGRFRRLSAGDPDYDLGTYDTFFDMLTEALAMAVGGDIVAEIFETR